MCLEETQFEIVQEPGGGAVVLRIYMRYTIMQKCCKAAIEMNGCGWWWSNTHHIGIQSGMKWVRCVRGACVGSLVRHDLWDVRSRFWCAFHRWLHMVTVRVHWRFAFVFNLKIHTRHPNTTRACTQFARTHEQMNTYMYCISLFAVYNIALCVLCCCAAACVHGHWARLRVVVVVDLSKRMLTRARNTRPNLVEFPILGLLSLLTRD